jgi:transcriptional regulator with XRE-family HTH domain
MSNLPENLKILRVQAGLSQRDLAKKLDCNSVAIAKYEAGTVTPRVETIIRLSKLFAVTIDDMINKKFSLV